MHGLCKIIIFMTIFYDIDSAKLIISYYPLNHSEKNKLYFLFAKFC